MQHATLVKLQNDENSFWFSLPPKTLFFRLSHKVDLLIHLSVPLKSWKMERNGVEKKKIKISLPFFPKVTEKGSTVLDPHNRRMQESERRVQCSYRHYKTIIAWCLNIALWCFHWDIPLLCDDNESWLNFAKSSCNDCILL